MYRSLILDEVLRVEQSGFPAPPERAKRKLAAILAADVAGYSWLMGVIEAGTLARLKTNRRERSGTPISQAPRRRSVRGM